jgi:hypothetical protein
MAPTKLRPQEFIEKYFNAMTNLMFPDFDKDKIHAFYKNNNGHRSYSKDSLCRMITIKIYKERYCIKNRLQSIYEEVAHTAESKLKIKSSEPDNKIHEDNYPKGLIHHQRKVNAKLKIYINNTWVPFSDWIKMAPIQ